MRRILLQREIVTGFLDGQNIAGTDRIVHEPRSTPARCILQHADPVAVALGLRIGERVLTSQSVRQMQFDMRAGRECGQRGTVGRAQVQRENILGFVGDGLDPKLQVRPRPPG